VDIGCDKSLDHADAKLVVLMLCISADELDKTVSANVLCVHFVD